jgi:hypothetical protein
MKAALVLLVATGIFCMAQQPRTPDLDAQRAAMKKLDFMVGKWGGEARILIGPGAPAERVQTEEAQYKLDGLILLIEGVGRNKTDGKLALQALAVVSYDDESETYHMRAFNDGRFLETEVKLTANGKGITWGFALGQYKTNAVLRIDDHGDWTELHEIAVGTQPPMKYMELRVSRQK